MKHDSRLLKVSLCVGVILPLLGSLLSFAAAQTCVQPPSGITGWWPGDSSGADISGADNEAVPQNGTGFGAGMVDQAFSLDGMDDFLSVGNPDNLKFGSSDFTADAWVRFNAITGPGGLGVPAGDMAIVDKMLSTDIHNKDGWRLSKQDDNRFWFCFGLGNGNGCTPDGPTTVQSATIVMPNVWYHVAGVRASDTISLYVNGVLEAQKTFGAVPVNNDLVELLFGMHVIGRVPTSPTSFLNGVATSFLNGQVDEIEIYHRALAASEIAAIFNAGSAGKCKVLQPCTLSLEPHFTDGTLTLEFTLGTQEPATWNVWLTAQNEMTRLLSIPLAVTDPPVHVPFTLPFFPSLGTVGILTTLVTPDQGIICSDFETVETGPSAEDAASSVQELQDMLLQHLVK
jgi:concanavalin A-like lectin/glucanase superfamily protein